MRRLIALLLPFCFCLPIAAAPTVPHFTVADLGELPVNVTHAEITGAFGINDKGQVVGGDLGAWEWDKGKKIDLGALEPLPVEEEQQRSVAYGINNHGRPVGASGSYNHLFMGYNYFARAVRFDGDFLTSLSDSSWRYEAYGINNKGQIVGQGGYRGFFFENDKLILIGTLSKQPEGNASVARAINNHGQVVGSTTVNVLPLPHNQILPSHAFLWQHNKGRMRDLGALRGYTSSGAESLNDEGTVVGSSGREEKDGWDYEQATLWTGGKVFGLGTLPGHKNSEAFGINNLGQIVGYSSPHEWQTQYGGFEARADFRAFLWQKGRMLDLNAMIPASSNWVLEEARAINNKGQIVGEGALRGKRHAFLLTPRI